MIELHDSDVESITQVGQRITVSFSAAYVHKFEGRPGIDPETGWTQAARLAIESGEIRGELPDFPCPVWEGRSKTAGWLHDHSIPIPVNSTAAAELELIFDEIHKVQIRGKGLILSLVGNERLVENFPGQSPGS
ncbi:MAG: hypothetical protein HY298_14790 [Verrucomicrobia bacterium]|nr:hypothetical protein [Verrucomicrobiota bacterium]